MVHNMLSLPSLELGNRLVLSLPSLELGNRFLVLDLPSLDLGNRVLVLGLLRLASKKHACTTCTLRDAIKPVSTSSPRSTRVSHTTQPQTRAPLPRHRPDCALLLGSVQFGDAAGGHDPRIRAR